MAKPGKILVTGAKGQLGSDLVSMLGKSFQVTGISSDDADICSYEDINKLVQNEKPELIIHAAAFTAVDECESNEEKAIEVNSKGTENVARAAAAIGARMFYYSTDYVFDGSKSSAYTEDDETGPLTVYGRSKLEGEEAVHKTVEDSLVIRIAWVYGKHGRNFVKTMLKIGKSQIERRHDGQKVDPLRVVDDQFGNPTWTKEIAHQTKKLIDSDLKGIVHATSQNETTWFGLARDIFKFTNMEVDLIKCTTDEFPRPAPRPKRSTLDNKRLRETGIDVMRDYDVALKDYLEKYGD